MDITPLIVLPLVFLALGFAIGIYRHFDDIPHVQIFPEDEEESEKE